MIYSLYVLAAIGLDLLFGDPQWYPHPVRLIGSLCGWCEKLTRRAIPNEKVAGCATLGIVLGITFAVIAALLWLAGLWSPLAQIVVGILLVYMGVAIRDLLVESTKVRNLLKQESSIELCRKAIARIVGRETAALDRAGICRACIETVAENYVDGIIAPLFYAVIASFAAGYFDISAIGWSGIGIFCYKAINTLDSMIGYKNETYLNFGRCAAKLDDIVNFIPARLASLGLVLAVWLMGLDGRGAWRILVRDRLAHSSPNAGHPEAVVAGALNIRLGGPSYYSGALVEKPYIGEDIRPVSWEDISSTNRIILMGTGVFVAALLAVRYLIPFLLDM